MGIFKSSQELLEKGQDLIKQREFEKALSVLQTAEEKAKSNGENSVFAISHALACVMMTFGKGHNPTNFYNASMALQQMGDNDLKIGIMAVNAKSLTQECFITCEELSVLAIPNSVQHLIERANRLQDVGVKYQTQIGNNTLFILELFSNSKETGINRSYRLFAESQENRAEATVWEDPKKAAEYYQIAANFRKQIGDGQNEKNDMAKGRQYSKSVSCWFCNREITGQQVHFFIMDSELTLTLRSSKVDSPLPSMHESQDLIYACRGCHSAISKKADEIALRYHIAAMERMNDIQNELQHEINSLQQKVNHLNHNSHRH